MRSCSVAGIGLSASGQRLTVIPTTGLRGVGMSGAPFYKSRILKPDNNGHQHLKNSFLKNKHCFQHFAYDNSLKPQDNTVVSSYYCQHLTDGETEGQRG